MNTLEYSRILRLRLLDVARETQRGVDYAIKAYKFANPEFCSIVRERTYDIDVLHREITELVRDLLVMELPGESHLRFILASERIANAVRVVHSQAVEIAASSMRIVENGGGLGCAELATMGDLVNSLVRLSVVALFDEDVEHAELVSVVVEWARCLSQLSMTGIEPSITVRGLRLNSNALLQNTLDTLLNRHMK